MQKLPVDLKGSGYLIFLSMLLASNQIAIKVGNQGFDPVFMAASRSLIGLLALLVWMYFRNLLVFPLKTNFIPGFFLGFLLWFWLVKKYYASGVASCAFLTPVFSVLLANITLNDAIESSIFLALILVSIGLYLINKRNSKTSKI